MKWGEKPRWDGHPEENVCTKKKGGELHNPCMSLKMFHNERTKNPVSVVNKC